MEDMLSGLPGFICVDKIQIKSLVLIALRCFSEKHHAHVFVEIASK